MARSVPDTLVVANTVPSVSNVSISPSTPYTNDELTCAYDFDDVDLDSDQSVIEWRSAATQGGSSTPIGSGPTLDSANFSRDQWISCHVTANDGTANGNSASDELQILNSLPAVSNALVEPGTITYSTSSVSCSYTFDDDDGDSNASVISWYKNGSLVATAATYAGPFYGGDEISCSVASHDGTASGNTTTSPQVTVSNTAPSVSNVSISPSAGNAYHATELSCSYDFTDVDLDIDNSITSWSVNGVPAGTGSTLAAESFVGGDSVVCSVQAIDGHSMVGNTASATRVISNTAPTVSSVLIVPSAAYTNTNLECGYTYDDDDNDPDQSTYTWRVAANSTDLGTIVGTSSQLSSTNFTRDQWVTCIVTANDGETTGNSASHQIQILNTVPSVTNASISPTPMTNATSQVACNYTWDDGDGDADASTVSWFHNGVDTASGAQYTGPFHGGDTLFCRVVAYDGSATGNTINSLNVTVGNTAPTVEVTSITPPNPITSSTLTCNANTNDVDGDLVSVTYDWSVGSGATIQSGPNNQFSGSFAYQDSVKCTAIPYDGQATGPSDALSIQIVNAVPSISSVTISASTDPITVLSTFSSAVSGYQDPDGHAAANTYQWRRNGVDITGQTGANLGDGFAVRGDDITLVVTPCDNQGGCGTPQGSNTLDVLNASPTSPTVTVSPSPAEPDDDLACLVSVAATDPDLDPVNYEFEWQLQGGVGVITGQVLSSANTALGDTWQCRGRAVDDQLAGNSTGPWSAYGTRTVEDVTAPPAPVLANPDPFINDTTLTITATGCESGNSCTVRAESNSVFTGYNATCTSGTFSVAVTNNLTRGVDSFFSAKCVDDWGNVSSASNTVQTQSCLTVDTYEDGLGAGDSNVLPIDEWQALDDLNQQNVSVTGTILKESGSWDADWYWFSTVDGSVSTADLTNTYNFRVTVGASRADLYSVRVFKGGNTPQDLQCSGTPGYTEYNDCVRDQLDTLSGSYHLGFGNQCRFNIAARYNYCDDMSNGYYVQVIRDPTQPESCDYYTLDVSNGLTQAGTDTCEQ